jgi:hypothetical protein
MEFSIQQLTKMLMTSLKLVLLVAVVTSQILGGVSCCCLSRTLVFSLIAAGQGFVGSASSAQLQPVCPKCAARKRLSHNKTCSHNVARGLEVSAGASDQCRCVKLDVKSSVLNEPLPFASGDLCCEGQHLNHWASCEIEPVSVRDYQIPDRFGGRSWQSIACVWKN